MDSHVGGGSRAVPRAAFAAGWLAVSLLSAPVVAVFYFCSFTGNVVETHYDAGRLLLQVSPVGMALLARWARRLG
jgi:hypothetical protein